MLFIVYVGNKVGNICVHCIQLCLGPWWCRDLERPLFLLRNNILTGTGSLYHHRPKDGRIQCTRILPTYTINGRRQQILRCYN